MNYKKYIESIKRDPPEKISDQVWERIHQTITQPEPQKISFWTTWFKPIYLVPILAPTLVIVGIFWINYNYRQVEYQRMMMFSQSTAYIYSISKY